MDVRQAGNAHGIADHVRAVRERMAQAAVRARRSPHAVRLIAATKTVPAEIIEAVIAAGIHECGESRVQEALPKLQALGHFDVAWHFIGRLQRRKVKSVVGRFQLIHSVDSLELAQEIERRAAEIGVTQRVLVEVNIGAEASKGGFLRHEFFGALETLDELPHLSVCGVMTIPPRTEDPEGARAYFQALRELARDASRRSYRRIGLDELSMGMSDDFEIAIEEGATMVRIGTAIFGERPKEQV